MAREDMHARSVPESTCCTAISSLHDHAGLRALIDLRGPSEPLPSRRMPPLLPL